MQVKTEEGGLRNAPLLEVTRENFVVPKGEEHLYHCRIERKQFDAKTGKRLSVPAYQIFGKKFFETFGLHNLVQQGYDVDVLHDPILWERDHAAELAAAKKAAEEAAAAKAAAEKEAERAALTAEIIEQLKAEGWAPKTSSKKQTATEAAE